MAATAPKAAGLPLPQTLIDEALRLDIEITDRSEEQVRRAVREAWIEENRESIEDSNARGEEHGPPLAKYRQF